MTRSKISQLKKEMAEAFAKQDKKETMRKGREILKQEKVWMNMAFEHAKVPYEAIVEPDMYEGYTVGLAVKETAIKDFEDRYLRLRPYRVSCSNAANAAEALDIIRGTLIWLGWHTAEECPAVVEDLPEE